MIKTYQSRVLNNVSFLLSVLIILRRSIYLHGLHFALDTTKEYLVTINVNIHGTMRACTIQNEVSRADENVCTEKKHPS